MLRMPVFRYHHARSAVEAVELHASLGGGEPGRALYVAGGTDLLPNIKHRLFRPEHVVGLAGLPAGVVDEGDAVVVGGGLSLDTLADHPLVQRELAPLAQAAGLVAGPQIRRMGTLGGNVLLDTRCLFYNQSEFWRKALGYCLKAEGTWCHVVGGPKTCVAAQSSDTVPVLLALDASIDLLSTAGERTVRLRDLYRFNGMDHLTLTPGELLTRVRIPKPGAGFRGGYRKLRTRGAIDFPQIGVAVATWWQGPELTRLEVVVGAANPQPKPVRGLEGLCGRAVDEAALDALSDAVVKQTRPQKAVHGDPAWRRAMAGVFARRLLADLRDAA